MKTDQRIDNLRRVAILVASVDDALGNQLLESLPERDAAEVHKLIDQLGEIDPEEQEKVLLEFQRSTALEPSSAHSRKDLSLTSDAVELDIDATIERQMERLEEYERALEAQQEAPNEDADSSGQKISSEQRRQLIAEASGSELAGQLTEEHPQVIALVLSRLTETQAAETLSHLPPATQSLVIQRLVYSHPAVDDAVEELEVQLAERLEQRRRHQEYFQCGSDLARRILQNAPEHERRVILDRIQQHDPEVATALNEEPTSTAATTLGQNRFAKAYGLTTPESPSLETEAEEATQSAAIAVSEDFASEEEAVSWQPARQEEAVNDDLDPALLETLAQAELQALLAVANEQVVQVYLGSTTEQRFRQLTSGLPRKEARKLRKSTRKRKVSRESVELAHQSLLQIAQRAGLLNSEAAI